MSDSSDLVVVVALIVSFVFILTLITVIVTLSLWLLKLRRRLYKESQVNSDVVPYVLVKAPLRTPRALSASRPHPRSRNPVVYERIRCLNRFVA